MNEAYESVVSILPPEKSPEDEAVLLKFHTQSGEVTRLRLSAYIARHLGTQLLLLSANTRDRCSLATFFFRNPKVSDRHRADLPR